MDAPEIIKSGKYLINTKTNEYYKPAKRKGLFSKVVIAICIILIILYTMFCLYIYMQYKTGIQPTGSHDAYGLGAKVSHNGKRYISQIPNNTTEPGTDERWWKEVV